MFKNHFISIRDSLANFRDLIVNHDAYPAVLSFMKENSSFMARMILLFFALVLLAIGTATPEEPAVFAITEIMGSLAAVILWIVPLFVMSFRLLFLANTAAGMTVFAERYLSAIVIYNLIQFLVGLAGDNLYRMAVESPGYSATIVMVVLLILYIARATRLYSDADSLRFVVLREDSIRGCDTPRKDPS